MKPKYRAIPTSVDGIRFKSKGEAARYGQLKLLEKNNKINYLTCHPAFIITIRNIKICKVELDFSYLDLERMCFIYEDFKGCDNPLSKLKRKLVEASHNITVTLVRK